MWCVKLNDNQLETLRALIKAQGEVGPALQGALEALDFARWDELPEASLPWDQIATQAEAQGIGEADVIWDVAGRKPEPRAPKVKRAPARRGKRSQRARKPAS